MKNICVYASSSDHLAPAFIEAARDLGLLIAEYADTLVYGAGSIGLMGHVARAVHEGGGSVIGVIPDRLKEREIAYSAADELIVTTGMRERKAIMEARADAFVALPGGFGTLEEVFEVLTLKQLGYHEKPVVLLNIAGVYDGLLRYLDTLYEEQFIQEKHRNMYHVANTPAEVFPYLHSYPEQRLEGKWR